MDFQGFPWISLWICMDIHGYPYGSVRLIWRPKRHFYGRRNKSNARLENNTLVCFLLLVVFSPRLSFSKQVGIVGCTCFCSLTAGVTLSLEWPTHCGIIWQRMGSPVGFLLLQTKTPSQPGPVSQGQALAGSFPWYCRQKRHPYGERKVRWGPGPGTKKYEILHVENYVAFWSFFPL